MTTKKTAHSATSSRKTTSKKRDTAEHSAEKPKTVRRKTSKETAHSTTSRARTVSLKSDLKKFADEEYAAGDLTQGALLLVRSEGVDVIREALLALMASKLPLFGNQLSDNAVDSLVNKLQDDYRKFNTAERKAARAVLHWLGGKYEADAETQKRLLTTFTNSQ